MKISIVTASFNSGVTIADTLQSVAAQSYSDVEQIVVDGGSTDHTMQLVRTYGSRVAVAVSEKDRGIYDAMNKGWGLATGDVVGFLNSDDTYYSHDSLSQIAGAFDDDNVDACFGDLVYVRQNDMSRVVRYWKSADFSPGAFARGWQPAHPTFYVRRKIFERLGGFDLRYRIQSDFDLCLRFLEVARIRSRYIPQVLVRMRTGGESNASLRNVLRGNLEAYRSCQRNGLRVSPMFIPRKILSRIPQFFHHETGVAANS